MKSFKQHITEEFYSKWKNKEPKKWAKRYVEVFGSPDETGRNYAKWDDIANFGGPTVIKDEEISHELPVKHIDFVYSTRSIKVPAKKVGVLAKSSGSIIVDQLKEEVTARCHYLIKNAVTLGFVEDVVANKISDNEARDEYARRIKNNITPDWYDDPLDEYEETLAADIAHHLKIDEKVEYYLDTTRDNTEKYIATDGDYWYTGKVGVKGDNMFLKLAATRISRSYFEDGIKKGKIKKTTPEKLEKDAGMTVDFKKLYKK